ncbi:MAG: enoyl-CoA hydratase/isomerase family protein [Dehalococcoidia bacterium]|nr:enoyl-CoA hydratase/isomerase family protein [Dehalococcoidia bacterium]
MSDDTILVNKGMITEIILNRPEKRNAVTLEMERRIGEILEEADRDDNVRVVTFTGNGPIFSAGHDLVEAAEVVRCDEPGNYIAKSLIQRRGQFWWPIWEFSKPTIAGVHGYVGPIANVIAGATDFCIAAEGTRFSWEQALIGGGPGFFEPLLIGIRRAKQVMMMDGWYSAEQGFQWGFVNKIVPADKLREEVRAWAEKICKYAPQQIMANKHGINMMVENLGLRIMAHCALSMAATGHGSALDKEYMELIRRSGLKAGLEFRKDAYK